MNPVNGTYAMCTMSFFYSFHGSGDSCHLITYWEQFGPDQDRHTDSDLDRIYKKVNFEEKKSSYDNKSFENYPTCKVNQACSFLVGPAI